MFKPIAANQMATPCMLQVPETSTVLGVPQKTYADSKQFNCNWKSYGGTEVVSNDVLVIEDTATLVCWYDPDVQASCRVKRLTDGAVYEIVSEPENIEQRNMLLQFKVKRVKGGA